MPLCGTLDSDVVNLRRNEPFLWRVPLLSLSRDQVAEWGALREETDPWFNFSPKSLAFTIDPDGVVVKVYSKINHKDHARNVLSDVLSFSSASE